MADSIKNLFIVGAGFSHYAGLPLTSTFTERLLDLRKSNPDGPSSLQVKLVCDFVEKVFGHDTRAVTKSWPYLEDIFTSIDLSANTGHHLGKDYSPAQLRTTRRALIARIIRVLRYEYNYARSKAGTDWKTLEEFFRQVNPRVSAFLSMNWDTVIEAGLKATQNISDFDYGCDALRADFAKRGTKISLLASNPGALVLKPHGSANWLYCDACRKVFWFPATKIGYVANQLYRKEDWRVTEKIARRKYYYTIPNRMCPICRARALGTRFATFSYRKALDFPMHESSWRTAEKLLEKAENWIFVGYSLPAADYEFKLMLKRVQLTRSKPLKLVLITGGNKQAVRATTLAYRKFFGSASKGTELKIFPSGLKGAIGGLRKLGALEG